jgi:hypothetical protein
MSGFLPVTPFYPEKTKNAISRQLMGRFRSSFEELKPYPTHTRLPFPTIPNFIFIVLKLPTFFRKLPSCATLRRLPGTTTPVALENGNLSKQKEIKSKLDYSTKVMHVRSIAQVMHVRKDYTYIHI